MGVRVHAGMNGVRLVAAAMEVAAQHVEQRRGAPSVADVVRQLVKSA